MFINNKGSVNRMIAVPGDEELPLEDHFKELRSRMAIVIIPVAIITFIAYLFSGEIFQLVWKHTVPVPPSIYSPTDLIVTRLTISLVCALFFGIPLIVYETFMFVGKGLYKHEKSFFIKVVPFSFILFSIGAVLAYFIVMPLVFKTTVFYSIDIAAPQVSLIKTINTMITLVLGFGIVFQFPLLLIFAIKMGLLKREYLKGKRKIVYSGLVAFAFFISPGPEALSELIVAAVLVVLFEFSLLIARFF
ncbi:Sec-independent protein translocase protein TatC [uncultured archaeon]|nr:Sec-independent protein translocase protein TatC [uncultured archaeon]